MASATDSDRGLSASPADVSPATEGTITPATEGIPREDHLVEYAIEQALLLKTNIDETTRSAVHAAVCRLSDIGSTALAHSLYTLEIAKGYLSEADDVAFAKAKESFLVAAAHPSISLGVAAGLGIIGFKRPRRFLYSQSIRLFMNEESLLSRAETKAKVLKQSFANMKHEVKKMEERASMAENDLLSGQTRLRQAGRQIQGVLNSVYKVEKQARGLKDVLGELPRKDASLFRSKVSSLTSELKREKTVLGKELSKITGHGISV